LRGNPLSLFQQSPFLRSRGVRKMCGGPTLIVKNTFICAVGAEAMSPPNNKRRRSKTEGDEILNRAESECLVHVSSPSSFRSEEETDSSSALAEVTLADRCSELSAALEAGGSGASCALAEIGRSARIFAFDARGSGLVLQALEFSGAEFAADVALALRGAIREAACSPPAAAVLEKLMFRLGAAWCSQVADELLGDARRLSMHACGSSVIGRLLEVAPADAKTEAFVDEVLTSDLAVIACHKFGHAVAMSILSWSLPRQRSDVALALAADLQRFSRHRFASLVVAAAFASCPGPIIHRLAGVLMSQAGAVASLACHNFGVRVVKAMLAVPGDVSLQALFYLQKSSRRLQKDKFGAQLLQELAAAPSRGMEAGFGMIGGA